MKPAEHTCWIWIGWLYARMAKVLGSVAPTLMGKSSASAMMISAEAAATSSWSCWPMEVGDPLIALKTRTALGGGEKRRTRADARGNSAAAEEGGGGWGRAGTDRVDEEVEGGERERKEQNTHTSNTGSQDEKHTECECNSIVVSPARVRCRSGDAALAVDIGQPVAKTAKKQRG